MTAISATPTPLPPNLQPQGPDKWNRESTPIGTIVYHADPKKPFLLDTGKVDDKGKHVIRRSTTLPYEMFPNHYDAFKTAGSTFDGALAAAAKRSQTNDVATAIFQANDGAFHIRQIGGVFPKDEHGVRRYMGVAGDVQHGVGIDRGLSSCVTSVEVKITHPDVKAVVGSTSWVDARNGATTATLPAS